MAQSATVGMEGNRKVTTKRMKQFKDLMVRARANVSESVATMLSDLRASEIRGNADEKAKILNHQRCDVEVIVTSHYRIEKIDAAFARMSDGNYGTCLDCGDDIADSRLLVQPWAAHCASCQMHRAVRLFDQLPPDYKVAAGNPTEAAWQA